MYVWHTLRFYLYSNMELSADFWNFVTANADVAPTKLRLKYYTDKRPWMADAICHIECSKKAKRKFGSLCPELLTSTLSVEQATSEGVAQLHAQIATSLLPKGARLLDMTCGMGIDFRCLIEGLNASGLGIEMNQKLAETTAYNLRNLSSVAILNTNSVEWLQNNGPEWFDMIFIDPARRGNNGQRVYNIHDCQPDVAELMPLLAKHCRYVMVKLSPMLDVTQTLRDLPQTVQLHIVDEQNECRELLAIIDMKGECPEPMIHIHSMCCSFKFSQTEALQTKEHYYNGTPDVGMYLFEPSPSAMKAHPFGLFCERYGLRKLHPNTNLFVGTDSIETLPGRWLQINKIYHFASSTLKSIGAEIGSADVATRNFPLRAEDLQKRLKIKSGGNKRVIGTTVGSSDNQQHLLFVLNKT
jgi:hypothetical protein